MALFREFKPRKASYGFDTSIRQDTFLKTANVISNVLGDQPDDKWFMEITGYTTPQALKVYINDAELYEQFMSVNDTL
jgi:hypothetical protein